MKQPLPYAGTAVSMMFISALAFAQPNNNGQLDMTEEFTTKYTVPFTMPDGIKLMADVFLPIVRDCLMVEMDTTITIFAMDLKIKTNIEIIQKNSQLIIYDSLCISNCNDTANDVWILRPRPEWFELPLIFTRTPYNKGGGYNECTGTSDNLGEGDAAGALMCLLGYGYVMEDMRGRYASDGVYIPMYSDSWEKSPYHPDYAHPADVLYFNNPTSQDPLNSNKHEDGYWSVKYIIDSLTGDVLGKYGVKPPVDGFVCNGSLGMFGGSALGNTQLQAAAAHPIDPFNRGLKGLLPIVASNEHQRFTGYQNGVFRERIITGWLKGQIMDLTEPEACLEDFGITVNDNDKQNTIHTPADYNLPDKFKVAELVTDYWSSYRPNSSALSALYPNSSGRPEMDASRAFIDGAGNGSMIGTYSRYMNMKVPVYHLTGWWDIFTDGQIETWHYSRWAMDSLYSILPSGPMRDYVLRLKKMQKIVIGPWAHQTIGQLTTGDMTYKENVIDITKVNPDEIDLNNLPINEALQSEFLTWFRYALNYNEYKTIGEPKFFIPESDRWQFLGTYFDLISQENDTMDIRIPSEDYKVPFVEFFNFLNGTGGLASIKAEVQSRKYPNLNLVIEFPIPALGYATLPGLDSTKIENITTPDYENDIPPFRFYFIGPVNDGIPENDNLANFWFPTDTFPLKNDVTFKSIFLHENNQLKWTAPANASDNYMIYLHDPDDPVKTVGGGNMIVKNPNGDGRNSQGQMNLAEASVINLTMDREGVIKFETPLLDTSVSVIGFPVANIWAKTAPAGTVNGETDTDFNVRILDVYPDGREFFVVEGTVNARARNYARTVADYPIRDFKYTVGGDGIPFYPADTVAFSNIKANQLYEYRFKMMPLGYVWGKNHKIKILISSSNHPRYQSNANIPLENGEFFRRYPMDGRSYNYNGSDMYPRKAVQRIAISATHPSRIELPVFTGDITAVKEPEKEKVYANATVYPNPAQNSFYIYMGEYGNYSFSVFNVMGQKVQTGKFKQKIAVNISGYHEGVYFVEITDRASLKSWKRKMVVALDGRY
ncbi:MAG: T9SS type A sorting domain-containing protein [Bacteroidetes bacterium]|nr:T9SS type A sorting domain-containing protein [Bacteroidota bacterium]